jgi:hypothetical protein
MEKKIIEPVPIGLEGRLEVSAAGAVFVGEGFRKNLFGREKVDEETPLQVGDVLEGWVQLFKGWTPQPECLVRDWLSGTIDFEDGPIRPVFQVIDFQRLQAAGDRRENFSDRKTDLENFLPDCRWLYKNPSFLIPSERVQEFLAIQPPKSEWLVDGRERRQSLNSDCEIRTDFSELDLKVAGGWMDLQEVQRRFREKDEKLQQSEEKVRALKEQQQSCSSLIQAGRRYLEQIKDEGVRYLGALHLAGREDADVESWERLFTREDIPVQRIEEKLDHWRRQLDQLYPTAPVARSTELDVNGAGKKLEMESYQLGGILPRE